MGKKTAEYILSQFSLTKLTLNMDITVCPNVRPESTIRLNLLFSLAQGSLFVDACVSLCKCMHAINWHAYVVVV